jgi:N-acetyl-anhydromuramyl-L-alanine amidase AmpD
LDNALHFAISFARSPNRSPREKEISAIVLHNTSGKAAGAVKWFQDAKSQVSAHYVITRGGAVIQCVDEKDAAWHAGNRDINHSSIGIEIEAYRPLPQGEKEGLTQEQDETLIAVIRWIMARHPITKILLHRQVRATECPSLVWPRDADYRAWAQSKGLPE